METARRGLRTVGVVIGLLVPVVCVGAFSCREKGPNGRNGRTEHIERPSVPSPDGKYEATEVRDERGGVHYRITLWGTQTVVLTTQSKYPETPNDVKAGTFSPDSTEFAAAYHFADGGQHTWVRIWDLKTAKFDREVRLDGYVDIPSSVFEKQKGIEAKPKDTAIPPQTSPVGGGAEDRRTWDLRSPDGKYGAWRISQSGGVHFQVGEVDSGRVILTTEGLYPTPNDVKAGRFSPDSTQFAAAYHYGHAGDFTWIGVWSLRDAKLIRRVRLDGWTTDIPNSVFKEDKKS